MSNWQNVLGLAHARRTMKYWHMIVRFDSGYDILDPGGCRKVAGRFKNWARMCRTRVSCPVYFQRNVNRTRHWAQQNVVGCFFVSILRLLIACYERVAENGICYPLFC